MRGKKAACAILTSIAFACQSCAVLIHGGGTQTVSISTSPPGATVKVGGEQVISPAEVSLDRNKTVQVVATLPGYQMATTTLRSEFSWVSLLDLIFIFPWVIDLVSGASYYLSPDTVNLVMEPVAGELPRAQTPAPPAQAQPATQPGAVAPMQ